MKNKPDPTPDPEPINMQLLVSKLVDQCLDFTDDHPVSAAEMMGALEVAKLTIYGMSIEKMTAKRAESSVGSQN